MQETDDYTFLNRWADENSALDETRAASADLRAPSFRWLIVTITLIALIVLAPVAWTTSVLIHKAHEEDQFVWMEMGAAGDFYGGMSGTFVSVGTLFFLMLTLAYQARITRYTYNTQVSARKTVSQQVYANVSLMLEALEERRLNLTVKDSARGKTARDVIGEEAFRVLHGRCVAELIKGRDDKIDDFENLKTIVFADRHVAELRACYRFAIQLLTYVQTQSSENKDDLELTLSAAFEDYEIDVYRCVAVARKAPRAYELFTRLPGFGRFSAAAEAQVQAVMEELKRADYVKARHA